jgi:hypothetical protein
MRVLAVPRRHAELGRNLLVGQIIEKGEVDDLALRRRKRVKRQREDGATILLRRDLSWPRLLCGKSAEHEPFGIRHDRWLVAPPTQLVQESKVRDLEDPRANGASLGVEASSIAPHGQKDVLHEVLGSSAVD